MWPQTSEPVAPTLATTFSPAATDPGGEGLHAYRITSTLYWTGAREAHQNLNRLDHLQNLLLNGP